METASPVREQLTQHAATKISKWSYMEEAQEVIF
jgi:hypothetical protein